MTAFRDAPIRRKLTVIILVSAAAAVLVAGTIGIVYEFIRYRHAIVGDLTTQANIIGDASAAALAFQDKKAAQETLASLRERPGIMTARLFGNDGQVFAAYVRANLNADNVPITKMEIGPVFELGRLRVCRPVTLQGETVGTICLRADLHEQEAQLRMYAIIAGSVIALSLGVAFIVAHRLQRMIVDPVLALASVARDVAARADFSVRAVKKTHDEVGALTDDFNQMLARIQRGEESLRASEERFRQVTENIREVFWMTNADKSEMIYISPAYEQIWGWPVGSVYAEPRSWLKAIHHEDRDRVAHAAMSKQSTGEYDEEYRIVRPDGSIRWIRDRAYPVRDANGKVYRLAGIAEDITERRRIEQALRETEKRLEAVIDNSTAVIYVKDVDGRYLMVNRWFETLFHVQRDQVLGKTDFDVFPKERADAFREHDSKVLKARQSMLFEEIAPQDDGLHTYVSVKFPLYHESEQPYAICGISTDITERKKAEQALQMQARVLDKMVEGVLVYDDQERIVFTNPACDAMFGYGPGELIGQSTLVLNPFSRKRSAQIAAEIREYLRMHSSMEHRFRNRRQDGSEFISESRISRLSVAGEWHQVAVVQDVTERIRLEKDILEISERERARIGQDLHDGLCQHLYSTALVANSLQRKLAEQSLPATSDAGKIADLLDSAITQARQVARGLYPVKLEADGLKSALVELAGNTRELAKVDCSVECEDGVRSASGSTAIHLFRIAQEAATNAVRHAQASHIRIQVTADSERLHLRITDDGVGLPAASGQGMGLHIMRYRASMIGATLEVERGAEGGTVVTCSIPHSGEQT